MKCSNFYTAGAQVQSVWANKYWWVMVNRKNDKRPHIFFVLRFRDNELGLYNLYTVSLLHSYWVTSYILSLRTKTLFENKCLGCLFKILYSVVPLFDL